MESTEMLSLSNKSLNEDLKSKIINSRLVCMQTKHGTKPSSSAFLCKLRVSYYLVYVEI